MFVGKGHRMHEGQILQIVRQMRQKHLTRPDEHPAAAPANTFFLTPIRQFARGWPLRHQRLALNHARLTFCAPDMHPIA